MYRLIPGFPKYRVGRDGSVWSKCSGLWKRLKPVRSGKGYRAVDLVCNGTVSRRYVHRLVLTAFRGPCPAGHESRHLDGKRTNNRLTNLLWGTPCENAADKERHGTAIRGERHGNAKLSDADVRAMRDMRTRDGMSFDAISRVVGVQRMTVARALRGETWAHTAA